MITACRPSNRLPRQRLIELLTGTLLSSHQLAPLLGIPERQVEEHLNAYREDYRPRPLAHVPAEPSECLDCGFTFRDRTQTDSTQPLSALPQ